ncbi:MAG: UDP-N-acetylmuramoyl-L-alanyl-D-glutamate--2,6-diaminopimelate ligase [Ignavibacteria bacterium]
MTLSRLLENIAVSKIFHTVFGQMIVTHEVVVGAIQYDSRKVNRGDVFVAIKGLAADGHKYIGNAVARGAKVVVIEDDAAMPDSFFMHTGVVKVVVSDTRKALAMMAANYYDHPSRKLRLIGVTGTNGKTSTTYIVKAMLEANGEPAGLVGTIEYKLGNATLPASHTTPESVELNKLLRTMVDRGCKAAAMEVSSHALALHRVHGVHFSAAVFTNLTQDHLDFHGTMENYFRAKKMLFDDLRSSATAVTNADDPYGKQIVSNTKARVLTYGMEAPADVVASDVQISMAGTRLTVTHRQQAQVIQSPLIGRFNVQNILAAYTVGIALGLSREAIAQGIASVPSVPGRFQSIVSPEGWIAVIDYAHTPDALEKCLRTIHEIMTADQKGRVITVFGCGGDRDKGKRPHMGRIASTLSDLTVITSDNPRNEDPEAIVREIQAGCVAGRAVHTEVDRRKAIGFALSQARRGDLVLIAGKGHETYQIIGDMRVHFDDRVEVESFIRTQR